MTGYHSKQLHTTCTAAGNLTREPACCQLQTGCRLAGLMLTCDVSPLGPDCVKSSDSCAWLHCVKQTVKRFYLCSTVDCFCTLLNNNNGHFYGAWSLARLSHQRSLAQLKLNLSSLLCSRFLSLCDENLHSAHSKLVADWLVWCSFVALVSELMLRAQSTTQGYTRANTDTCTVS